MSSTYCFDTNTKALLHSFSVLLCNDSPRLGRRGTDIDIPFKTYDFTVSSCLYLDQLWVSVLVASTTNRGSSDEGGEMH